MALLELENLRVFVAEKEVVKGISLQINAGEVHLIMGQNGAGKSSLLNALAGHPRFKAEGKALFDGENLLSLKPHERARRGLFLAFQQPHEVAGVSISNFLRRAYCARFGKEISVSEFEKILQERMRLLAMDPSFALRGLNEGFSGGEKKRSEILQLAVLQPRLAMLDEPDSGVDVDSLGKIVGMLSAARQKETALLMVTHYARVLRSIRIDRVYVMKGGQIVASGDGRLAQKIEDEGYSWIDEAL
ncbi:MAG: Fe-S cluster assembly ATPase SufC [Candidatus Micrarchaeota archaeon]|nr:Fe-S cluster assembly ATPase SufC [Candidatus Micrarchaeota archaeon]